ncbi:MAG: hypothetical protein OXC18_05835 [Desulfurellaceae bacterium]|nr:hypothetical protein [Desulfurellaceae bacterium]
MIPEMFTETWNGLLGLSKVQLILLGGGIALLVALSKVLRLLFLALVLLLFLVVILPQLLTRYAEYPFSELAPGERVIPQD